MGFLHIVRMFLLTFFNTFAMSDCHFQRYQVFSAFQAMQLSVGETYFSTSIKVKLEYTCNMESTEEGFI